MTYHDKRFKNGTANSLLGTQHRKDDVGNKGASLFDVSLGKKLNNIPPCLGDGTTQSTYRSGPL